MRKVDGTVESGKANDERRPSLGASRSCRSRDGSVYGHNPVSLSCVRKRFEALVQGLALHHATGPPERDGPLPDSSRVKRKFHARFQGGRERATARAYPVRDMKLHSILLGWFCPDQALRFAAGILGKHASGGPWRFAVTARGVKPSRQRNKPGSLKPGASQNRRTGSSNSTLARLVKGNKPQEAV